MHPRDVRRRHFMQPGAGRSFRSILPAFGHERELVSGANFAERELVSGANFFAPPDTAQNIFPTLAGMPGTGKRRV
ncbi:hypothetical protein LTSEMON_6442 [Salmonella enterica subsp. enterica serovar Montevideo str. S5-403]|uniref:Uncharacterized protein n=1 Tax=Salmonella enterica subsp. enterica serovar Montevideo str. S5-403 TaxID=913242 RepID=G5QCK7_SALMO|nr:hypothetical protein LTSEMON_6442 [Salmonella enterica subsp. enterica serovar Montevideo str. S5-403]